MKKKSKQPRISPAKAKQKEHFAQVIYLKKLQDGLEQFHESSGGIKEEIYSELLLESLRAIISTLDEKDPYTHGHSIRVAEFCVLLGTELNLPAKTLRELELCALLHDIGKIGIPDAVLLKPARLSKAEFEIMKSHPVRSARILGKISALKNLIPGILYHHERMDGLGYPEGLKGDEIPLFAKIVLIADTYDAMTSTRPYRLALHKETAFEELRRCSGTQFDENLVEKFISLLQRGATLSSKNSVSKKIA